MSTRIREKPCGAEQAIAEAAAILSGARRPLVSGLDVDIAAGCAAIRLAERLGGAIDHAGGAAYLGALRVMLDKGAMAATSSVVARRADLLVIAGPSAARSTEVRHVLAAQPDGQLTGANRRKIIRLCTKPGEAALLHGRLSLLSGLLHGNAAGDEDAESKALHRTAEAMRKARFGVLAWSAEDMDEITIELVTDIIVELNAETRFSGLPAAGNGNVAGIAQAMGWSTGFPYRTGFGRGYPEYDPWRFDGERLMKAGECDAVLWTSTLGEVEARPAGRAPVIAVVSPGTRFSRRPEVLIETGRPGIDHDCELFDALAGGLIACEAQRPDSSLPPAAEVIAAIERQIGRA